MADEGKRFESWDVDCNDCARYYDNSCDGMPINAPRKPCNQFLATRGILIPLQIKRLEKMVLRLSVAYLVLFTIVVVLHCGR